MKNLAAKLKGLNYKQLVIDHGEKGVFGLFALIVLVFLAGTSWSRYEKRPEEFVDKVAKGEAAIKASAWSEDRKKDFRAVRDIAEEVKMLHSPLEASRFEYSTHYFWPMYPQTKPGADPKLLAVLEPVADFGKFIMIEQPNDQPQNLVAGVFESGDKDKEKPSGDDDTAPRRGGNDDNAPRIGAAPAGANPANSGGAAGADPQAEMRMRMSGGSGSGGMAGNQPTVNARGVRFVAVRGVFPLKDQVEEFAKAIQLETSQAAELVEFLDFELQRQVALPGNPDRWSGKWEPVDLQAALDVIDRVDFDTELVDTAFTDAVFTMPLPRRVAGKWNKYASHPKIKDLSVEMAEAQAQLTQKMVEAEEAFKLNAPKSKGGFSSKVHDVRGMRTQMNSSSMSGAGGGSSSSMMQKMQGQIKEDMNSGSLMPFQSGINMNSGANNSFMGSLTAMGNQMQKTDTRLSKYLLFRYLDFTVTPGNEYRYRMRLVLRNPNYKRPVEELVDASVAEGELRMTPWSEPTTPSVIPEEQKVFLAKVDRGRPESGVAPTVNMDVIQWFTDAGTNISVKLDKMQLGQFVGGRAKTEVLRPEMSLKDEEIPVFTGSILADISSAPIPELDATEHADLKVDAKRLKQIGTVDKALLVDRFGQLVALDPKVAEDDQKKSLRMVEEEHKMWSHLKGRNEAAGAGPASDLDRLRGKNSSSSASSADMMNSMMGGMMGGAPSPQKKGPGGKPSKKQPKNSSGGSSGGSSSGGSSSGPGATSF